VIDLYHPDDHPREKEGFVTLWQSTQEPQNVMRHPQIVSMKLTAGHDPSESSQRRRWNKSQRLRESGHVSTESDELMALFSGH
jgi:hypothetical protein